MFSDSIVPTNTNEHSVQVSATQLHEAVTEMLLSLMDAEDDRHPETGQMYPTCAQAWLAVEHYRKVTGACGGAISPQILQEVLAGLEEDEK